jgi:hypothetical protein
MRGGFTVDLEKRLRRADPAARVIVEAAVVSNEHTKCSKTEWNAADSTTGFTVLNDGTFRLDGTLTTLIESTVSSELHADLNGGLQDYAASPWLAAEVQWHGTNPSDMELTKVKAKLDPQNGASTDAGYWVCELFAVTEVEGSGPADQAIKATPIASPVTLEVTANTAITEYTFDYADRVNRPKPKAIRPIDPNNQLYPDPTTWAVIRAITSAGTPATNVGWAYGTAVTAVTNGGNVLEGVSLEAADGIGDDGKFTRSVHATPAIVFQYGAYATATLAFTTSSNQFDLGAVPTATNLKFVCEAVIPSDASVCFQVRTTTSNDWTTVLDGQNPVTIGVTNATNQTYEGQIILTPDGGGSCTPVVKAFGIQELTTTDLQDVAEVVGVGWAVDPITLKGEIPECTIRAIKDGQQDFNDAITVLLSENYIGNLQFRLWVGHNDLDRDKWLHLDDFLVDDYRCEGGHVEIGCLSPLALCKAVLPKYDTASNVLTALQYVTASSWTLKDTYEDIRDNQIELAGRFAGPSVEDDTTEVAKLINNRTEGKDELDGLAFLAGGCITSRQGRVAYTDIYGDKAVVAHFPSEEILPQSVTPGFANRVPEIIVEYGWSEDEKRYQNVIRRHHVAALDNLGLARLEAPKRVDDTAVKWINATNCTNLAETVGQRWVDHFANGMVTLGFESEYAHPELEIGDMVAVETDRFAGVDPNTGNAVKGRLWVAGVIVRIGDALGKSFIVWVRDYADIVSAPTDGTTDVGFQRYRAHVYNSTNQVIADTADYIDFDTEEIDEGGLHDTASLTHQFLIPAGGAGRYTISSAIVYTSLESTNVTAVFSFDHWPTGASSRNIQKYERNTLAGDPANDTLVFSAELDLAVGDRVSLSVGIETDDTVTIQGGSVDESHFIATRMGA